MVAVRVGYTGGEKENPTYRSLGKHTEAFEITFDPAKLSYRDLLALFWKSHNPCARGGSRQYMSAIFFSGEEQKVAAEASRAAVQRERTGTVRTPLLPLTRFWPAEGYHQKHALRRDGAILSELAAYYPDVADLVRSTAAARVNGFLGGHGTKEQFDRIKATLGLSKPSLSRLARLVESR